MMKRLSDCEKKNDHRNERYYVNFCWCGHSLDPAARRARKAKQAKARRAAR